MRNDAIATHDDNLHGAPNSLDGTPTLPSDQPVQLERVTPFAPDVSTGQFPADFSQEELFFMLDVAAAFPSEREFVALLGGDAAVVWDLEPEEDAASQVPSLEQRITANVFERLKLPVPSGKMRKTH